MLLTFLWCHGAVLRLFGVFCKFDFNKKDLKKSPEKILQGFFFGVNRKTC